MTARLVPVLFDPGDAPPASWRVTAAGLMLAVALWLVASPVPAMVRLDPIIHSERISGRLLVDGVERGPDSIGPEVVEAREVLASRGLLDEAQGLRVLWLFRDVPAGLLTLAAVGMAAPRRLGRNGRIGLAVAVGVVGVTLIVPQWLYADTIGAATTITD